MLKTWLRVYVDQALLPVLVVLQLQPALDAVPEAYHNPAAVWWGPLHLPRPCPRGLGGHDRTEAGLRLLECRHDPYRLIGLSVRDPA